jgi:hypothetical protein
MKISKRQLRRIIKEEKAKILSEGEYDNRARAVIRYIRDKYGSGHAEGILQAGLEMMNK